MSTQKDCCTDSETHFRLKGQVDANHVGENKPVPHNKSHLFSSPWALKRIEEWFFLNIYIFFTLFPSNYRTVFL